MFIDSLGGAERVGRTEHQVRQHGGHPAQRDGAARPPQRTGGGQWRERSGSQSGEVMSQCMGRVGIVNDNATGVFAEVTDAVVSQGQ